MTAAADTIRAALFSDSTLITVAHRESALAALGELEAALESANTDAENWYMQHQALAHDDYIGATRRENERLAARVVELEAERDTLTGGLRNIAHVLGSAADDEPREWKCGNNCEGCRHEMAEASILALNALGFETYKQMLDTCAGVSPGGGAV